MVRVALWGLAMVAVLVAAFATVPIPGLRIAHAGGAMPEGIYCNCREAFDRSYDRGFRLIETDLSTTPDGEIVLLHDWGPEFGFWFAKPGPLSHADFMATELRGGYHPMDLAALLAWMRDHPDTSVVTDVKEDNLAVLRVLAATPERARFIPQIYSPYQLEPVKALGFDRIIFTNYRAHLGQDDLARIAPRVWAVTVWKDEVERLPGRVLAYTVNAPSEANLTRLKGAAGIYTDHLAP